MIPDTVNLYVETGSMDTYSVQPSLTYRLDFERNRIVGKIDGIDAIIQFADKLFRIDKYAYEVYDWYYGTEIKNLLGKPFSFIEAEAPRIINESLSTDDRILSVTDFEITKTSVDAVNISFTLNTIFGPVPYSLEAVL